MTVTQTWVLAAGVVTALVAVGWVYWWRHTPRPEIGRRRSPVLVVLTCLAADFWILLLVTIGPWGFMRQALMVVALANLVFVMVGLTSATGFKLAGPRYDHTIDRSTHRGRS